MTTQRILNQLQVPYGIDGITAGAPVGSDSPVASDAGSAVVGTSPSSSHQDHKHSVLTGIPTTIAVGASPATGSSANLARADHAHGMPAYGAIAGTICQGNDNRLLTQPLIDALAGTVGTPSSSNKFVTDQDPRLKAATFVYSTLGTSGAYASWALLYAALSQSAGVRYVVIESNGANPASIPIGAYDLKEVVLVGRKPTGESYSLLTIDTGVVLTGTPSFQGFLYVASESAATVINLADGDVLEMGPNVTFSGSGDEFIRITSGQVTIRAAGTLDGDSFPSVQMDAGTSLVLVLEDGFNDLGSSFDGDPSAEILAVYEGTRAYFGSVVSWPGVLSYYYPAPKLYNGSAVTTLSGTTHNLAGIGPESATFGLDAGGTTRTITGAVATQVPNHVITFLNVGGEPIIFTNEDSGSLAANRFLTPGSAPIIVAAQGTIQLWYDLTVSRWRVLGTSAGGGGSLQTLGTASAYTVLDTDSYIGVTDTSANRVMTLPPLASVSDGKPYTFKDESGVAGVAGEIRVMPNGAELLDGANTFKAIDTAYGSLSVIKRAGKWWTI